jgi:hypothetical protein
VRVIQLICAHVRPGARPEQSNPYRASMVLPRSCRGQHDHCLPTSRAGHHGLVASIHQRSKHS